MTRRAPARAMLGVIGVVTLAACGAGEREAPTFIISDSAGVTIARNFRPAADTVELRDPVVRVGSPAVDLPAEYALEWVSDVTGLPDGRVVVADNRGARVAVFGPGGEWLLDLGRPGFGPGEHRAPAQLWIRGDTVIIWDWLQRRLTRFSPDGELLETRRFAEDKPQGLPIEPFGAGWLDDREWGQRVDPTPARAALVRLNGDGEVRDTLLGPYPVPEIGWRIVDRLSGVGEMVNPPIFSVRPSWTVLGGSLAWTPGTEPRIELRDADGTLHRVVELPRPVRPVTEADRAAYFRAIQQRFGVPDGAVGDERRAAEFAPTLPAITTLLSDDRGLLWAAEHDPAAGPGDAIGSAWDVLDAEGALVAHVTFPAGFRLLRLGHGRAYGVTTTELGVHVVEVFEIPGLAGVP